MATLAPGPVHELVADLAKTERWRTTRAFGAEERCCVFCAHLEGDSRGHAEHCLYLRARKLLEWVSGRREEEP